LTKKNIGQVSNIKILQVSNASGGFLLYDEAVLGWGKPDASAETDAFRQH
jgi:hypothetical protein